MIDTNKMQCCQKCRTEYIRENISEYPELAFNTMLLCQKCGNKRCPKAQNHEFKCTGSNELDQKGSVDIDNLMKIASE